MKTKVAELNKSSKNKSLKELFNLILNSNFNGISFSTSLGQEDQVLTDFIFSNDLPIEIFTLDTGRLFAETYTVWNKTNLKYKKEIKTLFPNTEKVENLMTKKGAFSFYKSIEDRKECCYIRKIEPLKRALQSKELWITGLRAEQSENRKELNYFEWDESFQIIKFNPLLHWSLEEVVEYLEKNKVPQNTLHSKGFVSIGCQPCTRAITKDEHPRAGRWYWENSKKECGLHQH